MSAPTAIDAEQASARVRQVIDETATSGYRPAIAAEIVAKLRQHEPDVLAAWLDAQAEHFIWQAISDRDRSKRSRAMHRGKSVAFREAREQHESGDRTALRVFLDAPYVIEDGSRRPLSELRRDDLLYVASGYEQRKRENGMWEAFHRALAKKVGRGTVADHFTEDKLSAMWQSIAA